MFEKDTWNEIWATVVSNKLRSFLTAFGVFWGIFIPVVMIGSANGLQKGFSKNFEGIASNTAFVWSQHSSIAYKGYNAGRNWRITNDDIHSIEKRFDEIRMIAPRLNGYKATGGENVVYKEKSGSYSVMGDYPAYFSSIPFAVVSGRMFNKRDIAEARKVCLIGEQVRDEIFGDSNPINQYIRLAGVYFQVVGVLKPRSEVNIGGDPQSTVFLPFTTLQRTFNYGDVVHFFSVTAHDHIKVGVLQEKINQFLLKRHRLSPEDKKAVGGFNMQEEFEKIEGLFMGVSILSILVGIFTLFAGVVGVCNIMLIVIKERTKEIGIKRALGAHSWVIQKQILIESTILTTVSGFFGLFLSVFLLELVSSVTEEILKDSFIQFMPYINLKTALSALFILILAGVLAGVFPAQKAIRIKPIDALRDE